MDARLIEELANARAKLEEKNWLDQCIAKTEEEHQRLGGRVGELGLRLAAEEKDVADLESSALKGLFLSLVGAKAERLEKEKAEAAEARLAYQTAKSELDAIYERLQSLRELRAELGDVEARYQELVAREREALVERGGALGTELGDHIDKQGRLEERLRELDSTLEAGREAVNIMARMTGYLAEASSVSAAFSGGITSGSPYGGSGARDALGNAYVDAVDARAALATFQEQIGAVITAPEVQLTPDLIHYADLALDTILDDLAVHAHARAAAASVEKSSKRVEELLGQIEPVRHQLADELAAVKTRIRELTEKASSSPYR